ALLIPLRPISTLFPYTTLFRSSADPEPVARCDPVAPGHDSVNCQGGRADIAGGPWQGGYEDACLHTDGGCSGSSRGSGACPRCRSEEHTSELQSRENLVCRLLL